MAQFDGESPAARSEGTRIEHEPGCWSTQFLMKLDGPFFTILNCSIDVSKTKCYYKAVQLLQTLSSACPKLFKQWLKLCFGLLERLYSIEMASQKLLNWRSCILKCEEVEWLWLKGGTKRTRGHLTNTVVLTMIWVKYWITSRDQKFPFKQISNCFQYFTIHLKSPCQKVTPVSEK